MVPFSNVSLLLLLDILVPFSLNLIYCSLDWISWCVRLSDVISKDVSVYPSLSVTVFQHHICLFVSPHFLVDCLHKNIIYWTSYFELHTLSKFKRHQETPIKKRCVPCWLKKKRKSECIAFIYDAFLKTVTIHQISSSENWIIKEYQTQFDPSIFLVSM